MDIGEVRVGHRSWWQEVVVVDRLEHLPPARWKKPVGTDVVETNGLTCIGKKDAPLGVHPLAGTERFDGDLMR